MHAVIPHAAIRNALRKLWLWSPARRDAKKKARVAPGLYQCIECHGLFRAVEIDHTEPVGPTPGSRLGKDRSWDDFMSALFCPTERLRCLCEKCHLTLRNRNGNKMSQLLKMPPS